MFVDLVAGFCIFFTILWHFVHHKKMIVKITTEITCALTLTLSFTRPMWTRRTKWSAPRPSCGKLSTTITIYLMVLETWSNMSCACQPSNVAAEAWERTTERLWLCTTYIHLCIVMNSYPKWHKCFSERANGLSCVTDGIYSYWQKCDMSRR